MFSPLECPFPHEVGVLYEQDPRPVDCLPKTCMCGTPIAYAPNGELRFVVTESVYNRMHGMAELELTFELAPYEMPQGLLFYVDFKNKESS